MPALCGNLFEMSVEGTRHEGVFYTREGRSKLDVDLIALKKVFVR